MGGSKKIVVPQNGWFTMENPIKMDDLGGKPPIFGKKTLSKLSARRAAFFGGALACGGRKVGFFARLVKKKRRSSAPTLSICNMYWIGI